MRLFEALEDNEQVNTEQMNIFDFIRQPFKITNKIRLIELFGGVGSQAMALRNIGANFEHWVLCEFEPHAVDSYNAIHGTDFEPSDITKLHGEDLNIIDTDKYTYLLTYSFPCQDLSVAGNMRGFDKGSGTRSGLLWEVERLLKETKNLPQVLLMENVVQVHSEGKNMENFQKWISFLEDLGYSNYWQDMNAKNYGMPQNRNRTIMVSILGNYNFKFPKERKLTQTAYDYLEDTVPEKYYISNDKTKIMIDELVKNGTILTDRQTDRQTDSRCIVDFTTNNTRESDPVNCITARYDCGVGHRQRTGSCVCESKVYPRAKSNGIKNNTDSKYNHGSKSQRNK